MLNHIGTLYIVATPIGNFEDITVRAAKLLTEIPVVACEDTRRTGILLDHLRKTYLQHPEVAKKPNLISYYEQNEEARIPQLIEILQTGTDIAVVTDAGTPGISDPGFTLVREAVKQHIPLKILPGASSVLVALVASGLPTDKFTFYGYLPKKIGHATTFLQQVKTSREMIKTTAIFFEAPHKLVGTLKLMQHVLGDIELVLCRELTKTYEEVIRGSITTLLTKYEKLEPKGEFVLLFN